jgi:hypothetical protein
MRGWWSISIDEEEVLGLRKRADEGKLQPGDHELIVRLVKDAKRLRRRLWWQGHAKAMLLRMLAVMNWMRRCRGKPPLVPEEWDEDE